MAGPLCAPPTVALELAAAPMPAPVPVPPLTLVPPLMLVSVPMGETPPEFIVPVGDTPLVSELPDIPVLPLLFNCGAEVEVFSDWAIAVAESIAAEIKASDARCNLRVRIFMTHSMSMVTIFLR
jgi:hypothetical protein